MDDGHVYTNMRNGKTEQVPDQSWTSRRKLLKTGLSATAAWKLQMAASALGFAPTSSSTCNAMSEQTVGPYYIADELIRSNIREGKPGLPLSLRLLVMDSRTCKPLPHVAAKVWHCDALGLYAGFTKMDPIDIGAGGPPPDSDPNRRPGPPPLHDPQHLGNRPGPPEGTGPPTPMKPTDELTFLRGIQFTNASGRLEFDTVFPGFYMGRTNHIHFKIRVGGRVALRDKSTTQKTYVEGYTTHIGQIFFPEDLTLDLMKFEPYSKHAIHRMTQAEDDIFEGQHGKESLAKLTPIDPSRPAAGYIANLIVAVNPTAVPPEVGMGGRSRPSR